MAVPRLDAGHTAVFVVDVQEKLLPAMHNAPALVEQVGRLLDGAAVLGLPVLVTEQYRKGLGVTVPELQKRVEGAVCVEEKLAFSGCIEPVREQLLQRGVRSVLVCGIEAHVCVMQTCLDLTRLGLVAAVVVDAVGSRRAVDQEVAVSRMVQAGVVPTTVEACLMEMVHEAGSDRFRELLGVIK